MTQIERVRRHMREEFPGVLDGAFMAEFGRKLVTEYNILSMTLVSTPEDEEALTKAQREWIKAFSAGYNQASGKV